MEPSGSSCNGTQTTEIRISTGWTFIRKRTARRAPGDIDNSLTQTAPVQTDWQRIRRSLGFLVYYQDKFEILF
jgi:hypothetical protein